MAKGIAAWLAVSFALIFAGIAFIIATSNLIGLAPLVAGVLSLAGGPFGLIIREGRRNQRDKQAVLAELPESRALDPLRGRPIMGGSPELFREIALRERLQQTGIAVSVTPVPG